MLRSTLSLVLGALAMSWAGLPLDHSFKDQMVPVVLPSNAGRTFYVSRYEVTISSWMQCYRAKACTHAAPPSKSGRPAPVTGVSWFDVQDYIGWARSRSGMKLRLPSLTEWRELDRTLAKPTPPPLFTDPRLAWAANYGQESSPGGPVRPSGSFSTTPDGISDLDGNVWEWTSTCYKPGMAAGNARDCPAFIAAGEHEAAMSVFVGNPASGGCATGTPPSYLGFRLVADR